MSCRADKQTEIQVSLGIVIARFGGVDAGASHMASQGVPLEVALRVLLRPHLRRETDWR